jgi:microcystin-dependent protein
MSPLGNLQVSTGFAEYLLCNGQNVSRTTYQNLFSRLGTTFGVGDGSTTFTLPNYQGLFFRGMGSQTINGTTYTGVAVNNAQQDAVQDHQHGAQNGAYLGTNTSASSLGGYLSSSGLQRPSQYNFDNTGIMVSGRTSSVETRPVNVGIYYYVKT